MKTNRFLVLFWLTLSFTACNLPAVGTATTLPTAGPTSTASPPPQHRIGVRAVNGVGEFYDRVTGQKFIPRGNNYLRMTLRPDPSAGQIYRDSTLDIDAYNRARLEAALSRMQQEGYNVIRIFINNDDLNGIGTPEDGLSPKYLDNLTDFLERAKAHRIYVLLIGGWLPGGKYGALVNRDCCMLFNWNNAQILPPHSVQAYQMFFKDLVQGLIERNAPLDAIFAYELQNEAYFDSNYPPLSLKSGTVTTANGKTYDMASSKDKQRMMDEGLVYWIDTLRKSILDVDPTALVTVSFFEPQNPHPTRQGDRRVIETKPAIWNSTADFIALHPYPGVNLTLKQYVDNFKMAGMEAKPILMGEFGAFRSNYSTVNAAAKALQDWQVESCKYGFDGWLLWTWDTDEQAELYNALGDNGVIDQALAPVNRPDPCEARALTSFENNIALGKTAHASRFLPDQPPSGAVDGTNANWWGAGAPPPQWIEIDLGKPSMIATIRLTISQSPNGDTDHQVWVRDSNGNLKMVREFKGYTSDNQVLQYNPDSPLTGVQAVRIVTVSSPSWVAWREIEVVGE